MWEQTPTIMHTTSLMRADETPVLFGQDADANHVVFYSDVLAKWVMHAYLDGGVYKRFDCVISAGADTLYTIGYPVNFNPAWVGASMCLYRDVDDGEWIIRPSEELGWSRPEDGSTAYGFWTLSGLTSPHAATFTARGTETTDLTTNIDGWPRWECSNMIGTYAAAGGATGTKTVGQKIATERRMLAEVAIWRI